MSIVYVVRTHGGLGNQIFQIFYAILLRNRVRRARLVVIHDSNYKHKFELDEKLKMAYSSELGLVPISISKLRLPKIISRLFRREIIFLKLLNYRFLDGYFQDVKNYSNFDDTEISAAINELIKHLVPKVKKTDKTAVLYHFRLLDFFKSESEELEYIKTQFSGLPSNSSIVTNNDKLFSRPEIKKHLNQKNIKHIESDDLSAIEVLSLMMKYGIINSNNSTLAFWAAIFNRCDLNVGDEGLKCLYTMLSQNDSSM